MEENKPLMDRINKPMLNLSNRLCETGMAVDLVDSILADWWASFFGTNPGCLGKIEKLEPIFVLRAHDPIAPEAIRCWIDAAISEPAGQVHSDIKVADAKHISIAMEKWLVANPRPADETPN